MSEAKQRWALIRFTASHAGDPPWEPEWNQLVEPIDKALDDVDVQFQAPMDYCLCGNTHHLTHGVSVILDHDPRSTPTAIKREEA